MRLTGFVGIALAPNKWLFLLAQGGNGVFSNPLHVGEVPKSVMHSIASSPVLPGMTNIGDAWHDMICCRTPPKKMSNLGDEVIISPANPDPKVDNMM